MVKLGPQDIKACKNEENGKADRQRLLGVSFRSLFVILVNPSPERRAHHLSDALQGATIRPPGSS